MKILVPLDGSELASTALTVAEGIAKSQGGSLLLLAVGEVAETSTHAAEARDALERMLGQAAARITLVPTETRVELAGDAAAAIDQVATQEAVDLIVMTTHGRSGLTRLAHGSVADAVLRRARVPVTLVRPSGELGKPPSTHDASPEALRDHLGSEDSSVVLWASEQLIGQGARLSAAEARPILRAIDVSADADRRRGLSCAYVLLLADESVATAVTELIGRQDLAVREGAFIAAGERLEQTLPALEALLGRPSREVRWGAAALAAESTTDQATTLLAQALADQDFAVRWLAARALADRGTAAFVPVLRSLVHNPPSGPFHRAAHYVLRRVHPAEPQEAIQGLIRSLERETTVVQSAPLAANLLVEFTRVGPRS
jgi:nucleotide-binding universal stress UspA family protein